MTHVKRQIVKAEITIFLLLYLGLATNLNTADGIPNCPKVIHKDTVVLKPVY